MSVTPPEPSSTDAMRDARPFDAADDDAESTTSGTPLHRELRVARSHLGANVDTIADEVQRELGIDLRAWVRPELIDRCVDLVSPTTTAIRIIAAAGAAATAWILVCAWLLSDSVSTAGLVIGGVVGLIALPFIAVACGAAAGIHVAAGHIVALTHAGRDLAEQGARDASTVMAFGDDPPAAAYAARLLLRGTFLVVVLPCTEVGIRRALRVAGRPVAWSVRRVGEMVVRRGLRVTRPAPTRETTSAAGIDPGAAGRVESTPPGREAVATALTTLGDQLERVGARAPLAFRRWTWIGAGLLIGLSTMGIALVATLF